MKRFVALLMGLAMIFCAVGCAAQKEPAQAPETKPASQVTGTEANLPELAEALWQVEALSEPAEITVGHLGVCGHSLPTYIAEQLGWFEAVGLTVNWEVFPNGPTMSEAMAADAWDCGATGIGGVITAVCGYEAVVLSAATDDSGTHRTFARKDSPIVAAGKGNAPDYPEVYGDAESWRGAQVMVPKGTTAHYVLCKTLEQFGLTDQDVNISAMDVTSANTAFLAGQGDVACLWGSIIFAEDKADYVVISGGQQIDIGSVSNCVANPRSLETKREAILKWFELYEMAMEWINNNQEKAIELYIQQCEEAGMETTYETAKNEITANRFITLKENYEYFHTDVDGKMNKQEALIYNALDFFVGQGNYEPETLDKLLDGYFQSDFVDEIYARHFN